jgi:hypothetical protein
MLAVTSWLQAAGKAAKKLTMARRTTPNLIHARCCITDLLKNLWPGPKSEISPHKRCDTLYSTFSGGSRKKSCEKGSGRKFPLDNKD